jgi:uncharacterized protein (TIGR04255 family)
MCPTSDDAAPIFVSGSVRFSPLELVAAEVRYPVTPSLLRPDVMEKLLHTLEDRLPYFDEEEPGQNASRAGIPGFSVGKDTRVYRLYDRSYTTSMSITPAAVTFETTQYEGFESLASLVVDATKAVASLSHIRFVRRVGLRYLNEIRVPVPITDARDWGVWVDPGLLAPILLHGDYPSETYEGAINYRVADSRYLQFRFAALEKGSVVREGTLQRKPVPKSGPLFVIDIDSYCLPPRDRSPTLTSDALAAVLSELHRPIKSAFDAAITQKLRDTLGTGIDSNRVGQGAQ